MTVLSRTTAVTASGLAVCGLAWGAAPVPLAAAASVPAGVNVVATTTVNIRSAPSLAGRILGGLERGQRIKAVGQRKGSWVAVRFDKSTAYVSATYLNTTGHHLPAAPTKINTRGTKITTTSVNVRSGATMTSAVVGTLKAGTKVQLTGKISGTYAQTVYRKHKRWVSMKYLARFGPLTTVRAPSGSTSGAAQGRQALSFAKAQLGKPYRYGATGPKAYDCSGLVLAAWKSVGVSMPRTSQQQFRSGHRITKSELRAGDLVFFYGSHPSHVAMYAGGGRVIHAPRPGKRVQYIKMSFMPYSGAVRPG